MAANGISTLATKQLRQEAKLALASAARASNTLRYSKSTPNLDLLPTKYSGNILIDNPNPSGLQTGRPWVS